MQKKTKWIHLTTDVGHLLTDVIFSQGLNSAWRKEYVANLLPKHYGVWKCLGAVVAGFNELSKLSWESCRWNLKKRNATRSNGT